MDYPGGHAIDPPNRHPCQPWYSHFGIQGRHDCVNHRGSQDRHRRPRLGRSIWRRRWCREYPWRGISPSIDTRGKGGTGCPPSRSRSESMGKAKGRPAHSRILCGRPGRHWRSGSHLQQPRRWAGGRLASEDLLGNRCLSIGRRHGRRLQPWQASCTDHHGYDCHHHQAPSHLRPSLCCPPHGSALRSPLHANSCCTPLGHQMLSAPKSSSLGPVLARF
jgi:hypothetical protein